jgi:peptidoglycan/LPS O-acetylase OafA/YrhL
LREKIPALDGVRGVAISLVMLYHFNLIHKPAFAGEAAWIALADVGWAGVDVFFVLSGFLITSILIAAKSDRPDQPKAYFKNFWMRRVLRIFPLYYAFLGLSFGLLPLVADHLPDPSQWNQVPDAQAWFWLYGPNFYYGLKGFSGVLHLQATWSLGVEEQFYFVWPVVVWLVPARHLGKVAIGGVLAALGFRLLFWQLGTPWVAIFVWPHTRMDALLVGVFLATLAQGGTDRFRRPAAVVLAAVLVSIVGYSVAFDYVAQFHAPIYTVGYTALAVGAGALLWLCLQPGRTQRLMSLRPLRTLGLYAYGLYLLHVPVQHLCLRFLLTTKAWKTLFPTRLLQMVVYEAIGFALTLAIAALVYHLFEKRFLALKRFFPR